MNLDLKSDKLSFIRPVYRRRLSREETAEVIVPDALPDILRILDAQGDVYLRSKDSDNGSVTVTGVMELTVLYVPESGTGVNRLSATLPFSVTGESPEITADCLIVARPALIGADARTVNPRKIVLRGEAECDTALYTAETAYNTSPREQEGVYFKSESVTERVPCSVNEKTFVFTDEGRLPESAEPVGEILRYTTTLDCQEPKAVGSRAVVKGTAVTTVTYVSREGRLNTERFETPFSQVVETDAPGEAADFELIPVLTGVYVQRGCGDDTGAETMNLEIHAVCQCVAYADVHCETVTDAYSTLHPMTANLSGFSLPGLVGLENMQDTVTVNVPVSQGCEKVCAVTARFAASHMTPGAEGTQFASSVIVTVIYQDPSGQLLSAVKRGEVTKLLPPGDVTVNPCIAGEAGIGMTSESVEVRVPVSIGLTRCRETAVSRVESVDLEEETPLDVSQRPSVVMTRAYPGKDLWSLAKKHMSTPELIEEANALETGEQPEPGRLLLIPRCR